MDLDAYIGDLDAYIGDLDAYIGDLDAYIGDLDALLIDHEDIDNLEDHACERLNAIISLTLYNLFGFTNKDMKT
jgi:hypothetical protein